MAEHHQEPSRPPAIFVDNVLNAFHFSLSHDFHHLHCSWLSLYASIEVRG